MLFLLLEKVKSTWYELTYSSLRHLYYTLPAQNSHKFSELRNQQRLDCARIVTVYYRIYGD